MDEFEFLKKLKQHFNFSLIGDDCAVLPFGERHDLLATADLLIEGTDFDLAWAGPEDIGHKALAVSLSDIAAMGGEPLWALFSIAVPDRLFEGGFLEGFYRGIDKLARKYSVTIAGGDVSGGTELFTIDSVILGKCPSGKAILRRGARAGELVCVSGSLGGAAAGLRALRDRNPGAISSEQAWRQLKPLPQIPLGNYLQSQMLASSMIDLSDGLSSDLGHICDASGVGAVIDADSIPVDPLVNELIDSQDLTETVALELALNGGEDFELLFTTSPENEAAVVGAGCTVIGKIVEDPATYSILVAGRESPLPRKGYRHFRD